MISKAKFEELITMQESMLLDFKMQMYDLSNDDKISALVKDIISMINTKRASTSFIIIGVDAKDNGENMLMGIDAFIDEAIIQQKIKDKIVPTPIFEYYKIEFNGLKYGVFEFPVTAYRTFLSSPVRLKGIEPMIPYYRLGTTNQKAEGHKVIEIHDWISKEANQKEEDPFTKEDWIMDILHQLNDDIEPLPRIILDACEFAKLYKIEPLLAFCKTEINGVKKPSISENYRGIAINYCYGRFDNIKNEPQAIWERRLINENNYFVIDNIFKMPVSDIEDAIKQLKADGKLFVYDVTLRHLIPNLKAEHDKQITMFVHLYNLEEVRKNIKSELRRILMTLY